MPRMRNMGAILMNCFSPSGWLLPTHAVRIAQRIENTLMLNPGMSWLDARAVVWMNYSEETRAAILDIGTYGVTR